MITPDLQIFKKLSRGGRRVAVLSQIPADLETPVSCFLKLASKLPNTFLLESAEQEEKIGRYSVIGLEPSRKVLVRGRDLLEETKRGIRKIGQAKDLLGFLEKILAEIKIANQESIPGFSGGWVGHLSYENVEQFESIKLHKKKSINFPQAIFFLAESFVIFDHFRKTIAIVIIEKAYAKALTKIKSIKGALRRPLRLPKANSKPAESTLVSNLTRQEFYQKVNRIKNYIRAGDCIQVVLSQRFKFLKIKNDFQLYRALRSINPSPYMFYFRAGKFRLIGSSPEMLVKKTGRHAELRPIAGTRPRGQSEEEDLRLEENLKKSVKEMAEHLMLVDLGRNDLGRVCEFDSVKVSHFARVERYSHVMHLASDVAGKLKKGQSAFDLLRATFPAGTVSGAPKIRAMQIIDELETDERGPYAGALGYFGFNGDTDMCLTIRTLVNNGQNIYLQAGAGIVKDSNPAKEYQETLNKALALRKALARQGDF